MACRASDENMKNALSETLVVLEALGQGGLPWLPHTLKYAYTCIEQEN